MKKCLFVFAAALTTMLVAWAPAQAVSRRVAILPERAQKFVTEHFPTRTVAYVIGEKDFGSPVEYEVMFTDKSYATFERGGRWTEVDCGLSPVPEAVIPQGIRQYVGRKYPKGTFVTQIERSKRGYSVELSNEAVLEFDRKGEFRKAKH